MNRSEFDAHASLRLGAANARNQRDALAQYDKGKVARTRYARMCAAAVYVAFFLIGYGMVFGDGRALIAAAALCFVLVIFGE